MQERMLKLKLALAGITITELAYILGISRASLSQKIAGKVSFRQSEMAILIDILKLTLDEVDLIFFSKYRQNVNVDKLSTREEVMLGAI